ncbi:hypothetical protein JCM6882_006097 [Rhodosporidiobolus microsporus]
MPVDLPNELLLAIVERVAGNNDIAACCLASRKLLEYAQPRLWRSLWADAIEHIEPFLEAITRGPNIARLRQYPRTLILNKWCSAEWPYATLFCLLPNLRSVTVHEGDHFGADQLTALGLLNELEEVVLDEIDFRGSTTLPSTFFLPNLVSLSLNLLTVPAGFLEGLLNLDILPNLQALAIAGVEELPTKRLFFPSLPTSLLDQLDVLQFATHELTLPDVATHYLSHPVPKLVAFSTSARDLVPAVQHISLPELLDEPDDEKEMLSDLAAHLSSGSSKLSTIWLSPELDPDDAAYLAACEPATAESRKAFVAACRRAGVELHWTRYAVNVGRGGTVIESFWAYARKSREKQREEAKKAVGGR